jgi:NADPH:quinone reductase-like Zn-dependent oxidoreductase
VSDRSRRARAHAALIRELGATPIDYEREDFTRVLPGGFVVVFDGIAKDGYGRSVAALKRGGLVCAYGYTASVQPQHRPLTIVMWLARQYLQSLWTRLSRGKHVRLYSINVMRATSGLVPRGPGGALRPARNGRHPTAHRGADLLR